MICISCNFEHKEKYCPNCGERLGIKKLTLTSIIEDAFLSITNMDKGLLFNIKSLILNPRKITNDYILGKRKDILNPISFLIFSITLYIIIITIFKTQKEPVNIDNITYSGFRRATHEAGKFVRIYLKYFWILSIIPLGISLKIAFKKYHYIEHLAISSFIIGQITLIGIISYLAFRIPLIFDPIVYLGILFFVYRVFENKNNKFESMLISLTIVLLFIIQLFLITIIITAIKYYY